MPPEPPKEACDIAGEMSSTCVHLPRKMGTWPEFERCCGIIPLRTGAIIIGGYSLVVNLTYVAIYSSLIAHFIKAGSNTPPPGENTDSSAPQEEETESIMGYFILSTFVFIGLCEAIIAVVILVGINKAVLLRKAVFYMTIMWLLNLLASLVNASREAYYEAYLNAINLLLGAYFILIVRSTHLQLEGRLDNSEPDYTLSRQRSLSENAMSFHNMGFQPPPPNYEEATRSDPPSRRDLSLPLTTITELNELPTPVQEGQPMTAVLPVSDQATVNQRRLSTQLSKEEPKLEAVIYDTEQFNVVNSAQVVDRSSASNSNSNGSNRT